MSKLILAPVSSKLLCLFHQLWTSSLCIKLFYMIPKTKFCTSLCWNWPNFHSGWYITHTGRLQQGMGSTFIHLLHTYTYSVTQSPILQHSTAEHSSETHIEYWILAFIMGLVTAECRYLHIHTLHNTHITPYSTAAKFIINNSSILTNIVSQKYCTLKN